MRNPYLQISNFISFHYLLLNQTALKYMQMGRLLSSHPFQIIYWLHMVFSLQSQVWYFVQLICHLPFVRHLILLFVLYQASTLKIVWMLNIMLLFESFSQCSKNSFTLQLFFLGCFKEGSGLLGLLQYLNHLVSFFAFLGCL